MAANDGFGVVLERDDGMAGYTQIAQLRDVNGPGLTRDTVDVTTKDSASNWREFLSTLRAGGEVSANIVFDHNGATHAQLVTDHAADASVGYRISLNDTGSTVITFSAFLTSLSITGAMEGAIEADITLQITGAVTFA